MSRGGSWSSPPRMVRSAMHYWDGPGGADDAGFRPARTVVGDAAPPPAPANAPPTLPPARGAKPPDKPVPSAPSDPPAPKPPSEPAKPDARPTKDAQVPSWAKVAPEQVEAAKKAGVPVAFENSIGMRFVLIPAGTFTMGSPPTEADRDDTETLHEVTLTRPYYLQTTEVTNGQYRRFKPDHHCEEQTEGCSLDGDAQPVNQVSWNDAVAFVTWLGARDASHGYRLPTEAEWERACRAGTATPFWWGASITKDRANFGAEFDGHGRTRATTVPVATLPANPWGLYETHGNVREWCSDWYDDLDYPAGPATDPLGPAESGSHLVRGGAYSEPAHMARSAFRIGLQGDDEVRSYIGFRLAASLPAK